MKWEKARRRKRLLRAGSAKCGAQPLADHWRELLIRHVGRWPEDRRDPTDGEVCGEKADELEHYYAEDVLTIDVFGLEQPDDAADPIEKHNRPEKARNEAHYDGHRGEQSRCAGA